MARVKTWKILDFGEDFEPSGKIELNCPRCGYDAEIPIRWWPENAVIAAMGLALVFDKPWLGEPPFRMLPKTIQCRNCRRTFGEKETKDETALG